MTLADFTLRHPYRSSFLFFLIVVFVVLALGLLNLLVPMGSLVQLATEDIVLAGIGILILARLGWWGRAGYTTGIRPAHVPLLILPAAVALLSLGGGVRVTAPVALLMFAALTLLVGFAEETFFRGLILSTLLPEGTVRAAVLSSFLFAAPHLLNIIGGLWDPAFTVVDAFAAFGIGTTFAAIRVRTGSIWPLVGLHALVDFCSLVSLGGIDVRAQSLQSLLTTAFFGIVFVAYGLILLRGRRDGTISGRI
ncbi:MAG TPA: CPBP family intramembrane glutamic endopeptidase [Methanoregula sp.]|nr:CPBP family intramembrane glutamic endopeptidase [Methanoregula sp.]